MFGIVGALVGEIMAGDPKAVLRATLAKNEIDIGALAADEFARQVQSAGVFEKLVPTGGESVIRLEVVQWGLIKEVGFGSEPKPICAERGKLVKADGTVAWENYYFITAMNGETPSATFEAFIENPQRLREAFTKAAEVVTRALVEDLRR
jgi:hypothetical protein